MTTAVLSLPGMEVRPSLYSLLCPDWLIAPVAVSVIHQGGGLVYRLEGPCSF